MFCWLAEENGARRRCSAVVCKPKSVTGIANATGSVEWIRKSPKRRTVLGKGIGKAKRSAKGRGSAIRLPALALVSKEGDNSSWQLSEGYPGSPYTLNRKSKTS